VILIHQRYRQTDGRTDGRHAISIPRYALVHRAVIIAAAVMYCPSSWPFALMPLTIYWPLTVSHTHTVGNYRRIQLIATPATWHLTLLTPCWAISPWLHRNEYYWVFCFILNISILAVAGQRLKFWLGIVAIRKSCYRRQNRAMPLWISICIEFYNGVVRFLCHSTAFLLAFVCRLQWIICGKY